MVTVRAVDDGELESLAALVSAYMAETFSAPWNGTVPRLRADLEAGHLRIVVAVRGGALVGFAAFAATYDFHHCLRGGELVDLYVVREARGRAVAVALVAEVARRVREGGGVFLRGQAVERGPAQALYERVAVVFPGATCNIGGRAFRAIADLAGAEPRTLAGTALDKGWNYEP